VFYSFSFIIILQKLKYLPAKQSLLIHILNHYLKECQLPETFQSWFSVTVLHMWLYCARLRSEGSLGKEMKQELFNHLWVDVELKLHQAGVSFNDENFLFDFAVP